MTGLLQQQLEAKLLPGMVIPAPIIALYDWIEARGSYTDHNGERVGFLFPPDQMEDTETTRHGGTYIGFAAEGNKYMKHWFGVEREDVLNRLCVFASTGSEGSMAAFWLDDEGKQRIVHMGSGSGSVLTCVLADDAVDFLRLIAIGYDEICWNDYFAAVPNTVIDGDELFVHPNVDFQRWVETTFTTTIPSKATEIVKHPAEMGDVDSPDVFCRWVESVVQCN